MTSTPRHCRTLTLRERIARRLAERRARRSVDYAAVVAQVDADLSVR
jgi:hypothetical protein